MTTLEPHDALRAALHAERQLSALNRFILAYGSDYWPRVRPPHIDVGPKRYCFRNAYRLARSRPDLIYVEGFALPRWQTAFEMRHAWCSNVSGEVFDPTETWADPDRCFHGALIGVALPLGLVARFVEGDEPTRGFLYAMNTQDRTEEVATALGVATV